MRALGCARECFDVQAFAFLAALRLRPSLTKSFFNIPLTLLLNRQRVATLLHERLRTSRL